ncbi:MAG: hypothetical protein ACM3KR_01800 [Deltaproteobacteria bacterium]
MYSLQKKRGLGNFLLNKGILSKEELDKAIDIQKTKSDKRIGEILREIDLIGEEDMLNQLAEYLQVDYIILSEIDFKLNEQKLFTKNIMLDWHFVPFRIEKDTIDIAVSDIYNFELHEKIKNMANQFNVKFYLCLENMITNFIKKSYAGNTTYLEFKGRREKFGEYLVRRGLITEEQVQTVLAEQQKFLDKRIGELLIKMNILSKEKALTELASHLKKDYIYLGEKEIDKSLISLFETSFMLKNNFIPFRIENGYVKIAITNIFDFELIEIIETKLSKNNLKAQFYIALKEEIQTKLVCLHP